jgi:hypothetical protein
VARSGLLRPMDPSPNGFNVDDVDKNVAAIVDKNVSANVDESIAVNVSKNVAINVG